MSFLDTFCPVPHTKRDQVWLAVGFVVGGVVVKALGRLLTTPKTVVATPKRLFKLAVASEVEAFTKAGRIESILDKTDQFIHLSDRTSPPKVARLFFSDAKDLHLIELDASRLVGRVQWVVGAMGDAPPDATVCAQALTTVHYLIADGCVHVYGGPVLTSAIVRSAPVPLGADGVHKMPEWL